MQDKIYTFSNSPHIKSSNSTRRIMIDVCIALLPCSIMGIVYFGLSAFLIILLSLLSAVISEYAYLLICGKTFKEITKQFDFTSCVTGLLVGLVSGPQYPLYAPVLASMFAIIVVKMLFGGTGKNLVNPAITGRIFMFISFQAIFGAWVLPSIPALHPASVSTGATILESMLNGGNAPVSNLDMFLGTGVAGSIGETCKVAILVGALYLAIRNVINIIYPVIYIVVCGLFTVCLKGFDFSLFLPSILSGGLFLGAFFMATDYVTSPDTTIGNIIYFVLLGLVTAGLRIAAKMEVVSFVILLMNLIVPLIDKFVINRPFGFKKVKKVKGGVK